MECGQTAHQQRTVSGKCCGTSSTRIAADHSVAKLYILFVKQKSIRASAGFSVLQLLFHYA